MKQALKGARSIAHRRVEPRDSLEFFPTPPWATRALVEHVIGPRALRGRRLHEPACGEGHMAAVLEEYRAEVIATDIFPYGFGDVRDFLDTMFDAPIAADWIITNPPFDKAAEFLDLALDRAGEAVAMFVRPTFLEGKGRFRQFFAQRPPSRIGFFSERVPLVKGRWDPEAESATQYVWLVWKRKGAGFARLPPVWIPPCRKLLTRPDDVARFAAPRPLAPAPMFDAVA